MRKKPSHYQIFILLLLVGATITRLFGINWDQGYYLHPDERMIFLVAHRLAWPQSLIEFFQAQSPLNPKFFAYGSWPIYLLRGSFSLSGLLRPDLATYSESYLVGRTLSVLFDLGTIIFLIKIGQQLGGNKKTAFWSGLFYALAVLPTQLAHFYTVDTLLTFFIIGAIFFSYQFIDQPQPNKKPLIWSGIFFGMALASKISALPFGLIILGACLLANRSGPKTNWKKIINNLIGVGLATMFTFILLSPYTLIDAGTFISQIKEQQAMTKNPFIFPYTLQYVFTPAYWYQLKNYFLWGAGPFLAGASWLAWLLLAGQTLKKPQSLKNQKIALLLGVSLIYFLIIGQFAVKFMRYLLPLYPLMALLTALFFSKQKSWTRWLIALPSLAWLLAFLSIYTKPHSRIEASAWINQNVPPGSTIAVEHWDDRLPLFGQENYQFETLELYQPESFAKWEKIDHQLEQANYLIIASHRLYQPLLNLSDCTRLPANKCYPQTAQYYQKLFSGQLSFNEVAHFHHQPTINLGSKSLVINDFGADESFTVYDHPPIMIFKKSLP